jgi:RimJ/RimL family protein N-acetyltransferase
MIQGELINLRAIDRGDTTALYRGLNDPAIMRGWGWSAAACSLSETARRVEDWLGQEAWLGRPAALVAETLAGEPVGLVVLRVDRPEAHALELSLLVASERWGQGFGRDILETTLDACFDGWGVHRVGVRVEADNARALALYRSAGFQEEGRLRQAAFYDGHYADIVLYAILASEWRARQRM